MAATELYIDDGVSTVRWSRTGLHEVLSVHIFNWCARVPTLVPRGLPETLWTYLEFLFATERIDPASDPLCELHKPLRCYGGLDECGRRERDDRASRMPCECYVEYREPKVGELTDRG